MSKCKTYRFFERLKIKCSVKASELWSWSRGSGSTWGRGVGRVHTEKPFTSLKLLETHQFCSLCDLKALLNCRDTANQFLLGFLNGWSATQKRVRLHFSFVASSTLVWIILNIYRKFIVDLQETKCVYNWRLKVVNISFSVELKMKSRQKAKCRVKLQQDYKEI